MSHHRTWMFCQTKPGEESTEKVEGMLDPVSGSGLGERLITTPNQYTSGGTEGLAQFKKGFLRFKQEVIRTHADHFKSLAASQSPKVMVIACCDSRVDPALLMGAGPGDIFTVRYVFLGPSPPRPLLTCCAFRALSRAATSRTWCLRSSARAHSTARVRRWSMQCAHSRWSISW